MKNLGNIIYFVKCTVCVHVVEKKFLNVPGLCMLNVKYVVLFLLSKKDANFV